MWPRPWRRRPTAAAMLASPWNPAAARRLRAAARRARPDVAHVHNTWFALTPSVVAALDGIVVPVVVTLHNYRLLCANASLFRDGRPCQDCVGTHPWHGVQHRCYRGSAVSSTAVAATIAVNRALGTWERHVRLFLALNDFARDRFVAGGLPADRVWVKPNSVGDPGPRAGPPSRSRTVLVAGRLTPEKGVGVLLEAWRRLAPADLELVIAGDGPMRAELERAAPGGALPRPARPGGRAGLDAALPGPGLPDLAVRGAADERAGGVRGRAGCARLPPWRERRVVGPRRRLAGPRGPDAWPSAWPAWPTTSPSTPPGRRRGGCTRSGSPSGTTSAPSRPPTATAPCAAAA